ncbi:hypothetical protein ABEG17_06535 [Pedococcus sp. KACC 23699]|uniref:Uncharacterized protein n=1 Tax=Pedococcus sp. KACC 23699 TaxID=3149228 RepID=A0AAU7JXW5_9MICO
MGLLSRLFDDEPHPNAAHAMVPSAIHDDSTPSLRRKHAEVIAEINRNGGNLPLAGSVVARRVTDAVGAVLVRDDVERLDPYARITINAILVDYLPNAIRTFVAAARAGVSDQRLLLDQLDALYDSAARILSASEAHDVQALQTQSSFLTTKFTKSDLDL